jgi:hypothetical protein
MVVRGADNPAPRPFRGASRLAPVASAAALLLASLAVFFLLAEAAVRLLGLGPLPLAIYTPHPTRMFAMAPGRDVRFIDEEFDTRVRIGPDGIRNPAVPSPDRAGRPRVLALGDSFTFGYGVEAGEAWPARLQGELRARGLPRAEVINAGIPAYGPDQELDLLRECLPRWRPDVVVLGLYVGNDVAEVMLHRSAPPLFVSAEGALIENPTGSDRHPGAVRTWLGRHSRLAAFLRVRGYRLLVALGLRPAPPLYHAGYFDDALGATHAYDRAWPPLEDMLRAMNGASRARGARFVVALIPMDVQVSEKYWGNYQELGFRFDPAILREARPQDRLRAFAAAEGTPLVDLLPAFRAHSNDTLYFRKNPHWTTAGQRLAARTLAPPVIILSRSDPLHP